MRILISTPSLVPHDAVSNDVLQQREWLLKAGHEVHLFAEFSHDSLQPFLTKKSEFLRFLKETSTSMIYHHSVYWPIADEFVRQANCKILLKYHNITPPSFFPYDHVRQYMTSQGRNQTRQLIESGKISLFVGDSYYNTKELLDAGADKHKSHVLAPFHRVHDFDGLELNQALVEKLRDNRKHILFVGRVAPNKGHKHLLNTLNRYVDFYGDRIHLHIIGGVLSGDGPYLQELEEIVEGKALSSLVTFHDKLSFKDMHTYYASCDAFLLMSEHEGFCVPILEAQYHRLPILAWNQCAVGETMGEGQLTFDDLDYDVFAAALQRVVSDQDLRDKLSAAGLKNFEKYEAVHLFKKTMELLNA